MDDYVSRNGFFITMTFNQRDIASRRRSLNIKDRHDTQVQMENFKKFYLTGCRQIIGKSYNRPAHQHLQPFCFSFIDVENSKYRKAFEKEDIKGIHIHAIMIWHEKFAKDFNNWANAYLTRLKLLKTMEVNALEVEPMKPEKANLKQAVGYASKFAVKSTSTGQDISDVMIYPLHRHEHRPTKLKMETIDYALQRLKRLSKKEQRKGSLIYPVAPTNTQNGCSAIVAKPRNPIHEFC